MTELSHQFEIINPGKADQKTLVTIDRSNVRRWKAGDIQNETQVDEVRLVQTLLTAPTVEKVKIYSSKPSLDPSRIRLLETWLAENCRDELVRIKLQDLPPLEYIRALGEAILGKIGRVEISRRLRTRVLSLLSQVDDQRNLEYLQEMGAELILKEPKVIFNSMVSDNDFGPYVRELIGMVDRLQEGVLGKGDRTQAEIKDTIDRVVTELDSVAGISDLMVEDSIWADTFSTMEKRLLEISAELGRTREKLQGIGEIVGAVNLVMEQLKNFMMGEQFLINKCNLDVEIVVGTLEEQARAAYDNFVFLSGDGDFAELYRKLIKEGKSVVVVSTKAKLGMEVKDLQKKGLVRIYNPAEDSQLWRAKLKA